MLQQWPGPMSRGRGGSITSVSSLVPPSPFPKSLWLVCAM